MRARDPRRVWLEEQDCERLNRGEFEAVRCLLGAVSYAAHAKDDLGRRLECVPYGKERMAMVVGGLKSIGDDIIGTMPVGQCRQIQNTMKDFEMRFVPKMASMSQNVVLEKELAQELFNIAMEKCRGCVEDGESCRKCGLYRVLESTLPLENYGGLICPYSVSEWEE